MIQVQRHHEALGGEGEEHDALFLQLFDPLKLLDAGSLEIEAEAGQHALSDQCALDLCRDLLDVVDGLNVAYLTEDRAFRLARFAVQQVVQIMRQCGGLDTSRGGLTGATQSPCC